MTTHKTTHSHCHSHRMSQWARRRHAGGMLLAVCLGLCTALSAHALQLTDDRGVVVTLARSPQRIVSLWRSGVYRQTTIGQLSLYLAGLLGKL